VLFFAVLQPAALMPLSGLNAPFLGGMFMLHLFFICVCAIPNPNNASLCAA
jgi:hypothetical protein